MGGVGGWGGWGFRVEAAGGGLWCQGGVDWGA